MSYKNLYDEVPEPSWHVPMWASIIVLGMFLTTAVMFRAVSCAESHHLEVIQKGGARK